MFSGVSVLTCSLHSDNSVQSELHSLNSPISLTIDLWLYLLLCVFYCVYFHCMICFYCNYYCVLYPCYGIYVYVYLYCCDDFCGERGCYVRLFLSWIVVLIDPTNCLCDGCKHICVVAIWPTVGCIWLFMIRCGIVMVCGIILEEGTVFNEMDLISTFVTIVALNGLNVTMGYCIRFSFKIQSPWSFVFDPPQVQI